MLILRLLGSNKLNQKGAVAQIVLLIILLISIAAAFYFVQYGNFKLFAQAANPPIVFKAIDGTNLTRNAQGVPQSFSPTVQVELTSPLGAPTTSPSPSTTESSQSASTSNTGTTSYKVAENPTDLDKATDQNYTSNPTIFTYTFKDSAPGDKFLWVEFRDNNGKTDRRSAQIEIVKPSFSKPSASWTKDFAIFQYNWNGPADTFIIDISKNKDFSGDENTTKLGFAQGTSNKIQIYDPSSVWPEYKCGPNLYWRVSNKDRSIQSEVLSRGVSCPSFDKAYSILNQEKAVFNFTKSDTVVEPVAIDISTEKGFPNNGNTKLNFAQGKNPITVNNPQQIWDKYQCGATVYWRVHTINLKTNAYGPVITDMVNCDILDVKSLGAKGDGVTDDTKAIQSAIDKASQNNGGIVFIPEGTYLISKQGSLPNLNAGPANYALIIKSGNITLTGSKTTLKLADNQPSSTPILTIGGDLKSNFSNVTVKNLTFDGNGSNQPDLQPAFTGVVFAIGNPISNLTYENLYMINTKVNGTNAPQAALKFMFNVRDSKIINNIIEGGNSGGIFVDGGTKILIKGNTIKNPGVHGITAQPNADNLQDTQEIIIDNNVIINPGSMREGNAVAIGFSGSNSKITNNTIIYPGAGNNYGIAILVGSYNSHKKAYLANNNLIEYNSITGGLFGISVYGHAKGFISGQPLITTNTKVKNNTILKAKNGTEQLRGISIGAYTDTTEVANNGGQLPQSKLIFDNKPTSNNKFINNTSF